MRRQRDHEIARKTCGSGFRFFLALKSLKVGAFCDVDAILRKENRIREQILTWERLFTRRRPIFLTWERKMASQDITEKKPAKKSTYEYLPGSWEFVLGYRGGFFGEKPLFSLLAVFALPSQELKVFMKE